MSVYDAIAPSFDRQRALPDGVAAAVRNAVLAALPTHHPRLLDLGCGSGRIGAPFVAAEDDYVGVDLSLGMLRAFARRDLPRHAPLALAQAYGARLPFSDACFDGVLLMQVLSAAGIWRQLIAEATRVLRPSGSLVVGRTIAPDDGIDTKLKLRLDEILNAMGVPSHREPATDDAIAALTDTTASGRHITAASWIASRTPRRFIERHGSGARFSALPAAVRATAMQQLGDWAAATFGSLDAEFSEPFRYDLHLFQLLPGKPH